MTASAKDKYARVHVLNPEFDAKLSALIKSPPAGSIALKVSPSMASDMLKHNTANRNFREAWASELARRIVAGKWRDTGVPIIFSATGRLLDGQHRLAAIVEAETPIDMHVMFGVHDSAFAEIDVGKKRSAGDVFHINGVANSALMAAAANVVFGYDAGTTRTHAKGMRISEAELYEFFLGHQDLSRSAHVGHSFAAARLCSPAIMTAMHYICARKSRRDADEFFEKVATGANCRAGDPALTLRNTLVRALSENERIGRARLIGLTVKAWNAARSGHTPRGIRFGAEDAIPRAR